MDPTPVPPSPPEPNPYEPPRSAPARPRRRAISSLAAAGMALAVALSCVIGFVATCVPLGFVSFVSAERGEVDGSRPFWGGLIGGGVAGGVVFLILLIRLIRRPIPPSGEARPR